MPNKRYYDILSWLATQLTLSFAVLPFILLSFDDSVTVWSRVYFYGIANTIFSLLAFASFSPLKGYLVSTLKRRTRPNVGRTVSTDSVRPPVLGLPNDPERDFDEAVQEIKAEIEARGRRGSVVSMPTGEELKAAVEEKIGRKL
jgi:lysophospholipid acyltransferase